MALCVGGCASAALACASCAHIDAGTRVLQRCYRAMRHASSAAYRLQKVYKMQPAVVSSITCARRAYLVDVSGVQAAAPVNVTVSERPPRGARDGVLGTHICSPEHTSAPPPGHCWLYVHESWVVTVGGGRAEGGGSQDHGRRAAGRGTGGRPRDRPETGVGDPRRDSSVRPVSCVCVCVARPSCGCTARGRPAARQAAQGGGDRASSTGDGECKYTTGRGTLLRQSVPCRVPAAACPTATRPTRESRDREKTGTMLRTLGRAFLISR